MIKVLHHSKTRITFACRLLPNKTRPAKTVELPEIWFSVDLIGLKLDRHDMMLARVGNEITDPGRPIFNSI